MPAKYTLIILGLFFIVSSASMYLMISGNWSDFIFQLKWFLRIATPIIIVYLFYLGTKK